LVVQVDLSAVYIFACVLIIFWVARRSLFRRLDSIVEERDEKIASSLKFAETTNAGVEEKLASYEKRVAEARAKAFGLRQQLKGKASEHEKKIIGEARGQATERINNAQAELDETVERFREPLAAEGSVLGESIAEMLLRGRS
jgi:F0F1-type ATP synthase membrane subunit b/b'